MDGKYWKWRMHGAALELANQINHSGKDYNRIICTDMMDLALFKSLLSDQYRHTELILYMHENQLSYPWSPTDPDPGNKRDLHYGWINFTSCLIAEKVYFNSRYHLESFLSSLGNYLNRLPDYNPIKYMQSIQNKSEVLPLGLTMPEKFIKVKNEVPTILWNHRWEYDKNPDSFFQILLSLHKKSIPFQLIVAGKNYSQSPKIFQKAKDILQDRIVHWGYCETKESYHNVLQQSDIIPVTSYQDFFSVSTIEAIAYGVYPLLPDRLAFSEHLQDDEFYYQSDEELEQKLEKVITEKRYMNVSELVQKYNWKNLKSIYSRTLIG